MLAQPERELDLLPRQESSRMMSTWNNGKRIRRRGRKERASEERTGKKRIEADKKKEEMKEKREMRKKALVTKRVCVKEIASSLPVFHQCEPEGHAIHLVVFNTQSSWILMMSFLQKSKEMRNWKD